MTQPLCEGQEESFESLFFHCVCPRDELGPSGFAESTATHRGILPAQYVLLIKIPPTPNRILLGDKNHCFVAWDGVLLYIYPRLYTVNSCYLPGWPQRHKLLPCLTMYVLRPQACAVTPRSWQGFLWDLFMASSPKSRKISHIWKSWLNVWAFEQEIS